MSTAEATAVPPAGRTEPGGQLARTPGAVPGWLRLLRSELRLVFRRLRNLALLAALAALPVLLGIALRLAAPRGGDGDAGSSFISQLAGNGVFLAFIAITLMIALVLPLAIAVVSGDSVAGEAGLGRCGTCSPCPPGGPGCSPPSTSRSWCSGCPLAASWWRPRWPPGPRCSRSGR